jgi:sRNA-binding protein
MSQKHKTLAHAGVAELAAGFPGAFAGERRPLKFGIHDDLLARGIAPDVVKHGLRLHCGRPDYLRAT